MPLPLTDGQTILLLEFHIKCNHFSIPYLNYFIEDTWLGTVIKTISNFQQQEQGTCQKFNKKCSITQRGLSNAAKKLAKYLYLPHQKG